MADDSTKRSVIESTLPFEKGNKFVLVPVNFEAHWPGVVYNFMDKMLVFFDPMQSKANYRNVERMVNEYFGEHVSRLEKTRQLAPRQEDTNSCGQLILLFFECLA
ncbi:hypothetical protein PC116_g5614 [Phytophthora cactorum]|nr:hypothetical protein Pcac1_g9693 [Phytophthora cactorum]KAG4246611.1 hypothetical protein PC116_g5614 [Phytophthora cactorum]